MSEGKSFDPNSWEANAVHISHEMKRLADCYDSLLGETQRIHTDVTALKIKAGLWGALAGAVPGLVAMIYAMTKG